MNCFKVHRLFEHEGYSLKIHSWNVEQYQAIITYYQVDMLHEGMSKHFFQALAFGNKKCILFFPSTCNKHLKGKSCKIKMDPAQKILTY